MKIVLSVLVNKLDTLSNYISYLKARKRDITSLAALTEKIKKCIEDQPSSASVDARNISIEIPDELAQEFQSIIEKIDARDLRKLSESYSAASEFLTTEKSFIQILKTPLVELYKNLSGRSSPRVKQLLEVIEGVNDDPQDLDYKLIDPWKSDITMLMQVADDTSKLIASIAQNIHKPEFDEFHAKICAATAACEALMKIINMQQIGNKEGSDIFNNALIASAQRLGRYPILLKNILDPLNEINNPEVCKQIEGALNSIRWAYIKMCELNREFNDKPKEIKKLLDNLKIKILSENWNEHGGIITLYSKDGTITKKEVPRICVDICKFIVDGAVKEESPIVTLKKVISLAKKNVRHSSTLHRSIAQSQKLLKNIIEMESVLPAEIKVTPPTQRIRTSNNPNSQFAKVLDEDSSVNSSRIGSRDSDISLNLTSSSRLSESSIESIGSRQSESSIESIGSRLSESSIESTNSRLSEVSLDSMISLGESNTSIGSILTDPSSGMRSSLLVGSEEEILLNAMKQSQTAEACLEEIKYKILHKEWESRGNSVVVTDTENGSRIKNTVSVTWAEMYKMIKKGKEEKTPAIKILDNVIKLAKKKIDYKPSFYKLFVPKMRPGENQAFLQDIITMEAKKDESKSYDKDQQPHLFSQAISAVKDSLAIFKFHKIDITELSAYSKELVEANEHEKRYLPGQIDMAYKIKLKSALLSAAYLGNLPHVNFLLQRMASYEKRSITVEFLDDSIQKCKAGRSKKHDGKNKEAIKALENGKHTECLKALETFKGIIKRTHQNRMPEKRGEDNVLRMGVRLG